MKKSRYSEDQIGYVLRQAESGTPVTDVCRGMGISEATFFAQKKYAGLGVSALLIDKDRKPAWAPAHFEQVDQALIDAHFTPI